MVKATLYVRSDHFLLNNNIFNASSFGKRMKSDGYPFVALKKKLFESGIDLATQDINQPAESKYIFCLDYPHHFENFIKKPDQFLYLFISEPEIYTPESWDPKYHAKFDKVFTYNNRFGFNERYKECNFAIDLEFYASIDIPFRDDFEQKKLCALVANAVLALPPGNPDSLLHERYKVITWFGKHHPDEFDFYSSVCEERDYYFMIRGMGLLKKFLPSVLFKKWVASRQKNLIKVYKGFFDPLQKVNEISKYKFYLCYENIKGLDGYITEKIFECFYAKCVPIYLGAGNIAEVIPDSCFVDARKFRNVKEMYDSVKNISHKEYQEYIRNIDSFLKSGMIDKFSVANYTNTIVSEMNL